MLFMAMFSLEYEVAGSQPTMISLLSA